MRESSSQSDANLPELRVDNLFDLAQGSDWKVSLTNENPQATTDDKKWATAIAASIVSGGVGFITGSKALG